MRTPRRHPVVGSMLWAAYADALGFMSELVDEKGLAARTKQRSVTETVPWKYRIGGRYGVEVPLPAGMYSDDTQLRLATARGIGSGASFNVDAFTKVELPVWLSYALGGGKGTKAAATNLTRPNVSWFSNFYANSDAKYFDSGGNGAVMRIQPHVWATSSRSNANDLLLNVARNTVCTHGHPRALVGAELHALVLADVLRTREIPAPSRWVEHLRRLADLPALIAKDEYLGFMWLTGWEAKKGHFARAIVEVIDECFHAISQLREHENRDHEQSYVSFLGAIGGLDRATRGAGTTSAIASLALAWIFRDDPRAAIVLAANTLGSDTDTIGTLVGALIGATTDEGPPGPLCDQELLVNEAERLIEIAAGGDVPDFSYPSLLTWQPPKTASDAFGRVRNAYAIAGLGHVEPVDTERYRTSEKNPSWFRWVRTTFGQTLLVKSRSDPQQIGLERLPQQRAPVAKRPPPVTTTEERRPMMAEIETSQHPSKSAGTIAPRSRDGVRELDLEQLTQAVIRAGFDARTIGEIFMTICSQDEAIEKSIAFAAILAKAVTARRNR